MIFPAGHVTEGLTSVDSETKSKQMLGRKANGLIWHSMNHSDTEDLVAASTYIQETKLSQLT
jgi:hypothetical protein